MAAATFVRNLAQQHEQETLPTHSKSTLGLANGSVGNVQLPGPDGAAKRMLEQELMALAARIRFLESREHHIVATSAEPSSGMACSEAKPTANGIPTSLRPILHSTDSEHVPNLLAEREGDIDDGRQVSGADLGHVRHYVQNQAKEIESQKQTIVNVSNRLHEQQKQTQQSFDDMEYHDMSQLRIELKKHQQANLAFQKALREIGTIITKVANGDLSHKVLIHKAEMDPEITTFKITINTMMENLQTFGSEVSRVAREVGTEGRLGGQAHIPGVSGIWKELTENVNIMAENLTLQVREIAVVTSAVAEGNLGMKIMRAAKGEILQLQLTINTMVDQLRTFATEVTRVARDVGTEGVLGGQAKIEGVKGMWSDLYVLLPECGRRN